MIYNRNSKYRDTFSWYIIDVVNRDTFLGYIIDIENIETHSHDI